jgi:RNA polymerase sigma-70 factor, ECF subfamily
MGVVAEQARAVGSRDPLAELVVEAQAGDLAAMRRLLGAVAPRVARVVRSVLGHAHPDAEDAIQESLIAVVRALGAFRGECSAASYAARIAVRTAVQVRHRSLTRRGREPALGDEPAGDEPSPGEHAAGDRRRRLLQALLAELPPAQAETLALRVVLGCSLEETADATGVPLNTVRSRVRLAKQALKARIEADPMLCAELEVDT